MRDAQMGRGVVLVGEVSNRLESLHGDHDASQHQQRRADAGIGDGGEVDPVPQQPAAALEKQVGGAEHRGDHEYGGERDALGQVEPGEAAGDPDQHDDRHRRRRDDAGRRARAWRDVIDEVLGHDPQVERHRDHVCHRDHDVAQPLEPLIPLAQLVLRRKRLDRFDVVADRGADHPRHRRHADCAHHGESSEGSLEDRDDDQETAAEDRRQRRHRGCQHPARTDLPELVEGSHRQTLAGPPPVGSHRDSRRA